MRFAEWIDDQPVGTLKQLERALGVGYTTLSRIKRGIRVGGRVAKLVSEATGGLVTVEEIVCPTPARRRKAS